MRHQIYGIDFTSAPRAGKPLLCAECVLDGARLTLASFQAWPDFAGFEAFLSSPGPWVAGLDFPFGQSRIFVENIGWPRGWTAYARHVATLERAVFCEVLERYKADRPDGDREHRRHVDVLAGAISPQKLYGVPVGKMFYEGSRRLVVSGVHVPLLMAGDHERVVLEAYPGVIARFLIGRETYKTDTRKKQKSSHIEAQRAIVSALKTKRFSDVYGLEVCLPADFEPEPSGDRLDAVLCAIQAASAFLKRDTNFGIPDHADPLEGWICDPTLC